MEKIRKQNHNSENVTTTSETARQKAIEKRLAEDIDVIVSDVLIFLPYEPEAIILWGSHGKGEGAWLFDGLNARPYNDYDIAIISEKAIPADILQEFRGNLSSKLGVRAVDIHFYKRKQLSHLNKVLFDNDFIKGSIITQTSHKK